MKKTFWLSLGILFLLAIGTGPSLCAASPDDDAAKGGYYEVTVTNLTRGQTFTPIMVATHAKGVRIFSLGEPASEELARLAEGGDTMPLADHLRAMPTVKDVVNSGGPLPPGESVTVLVKAGKRFNHISLAAMLVPTNDGFMALNGVRGPSGHRTDRHFSPVYDAGSEMNTESCADIPGGDGCAGEGYSMADGEGYVHIHAGIHGIGDLNADAYDWRNPAARISIRRVR